MEAEELEQRAQETATKVVKATQQLRYPGCSSGFVSHGVRTRTGIFPVAGHCFWRGRAVKMLI